MKKLSKVEIARRIRDNGYDCNGVCACNDCPFVIDKDICKKDWARSKWIGAVDAYIKRYSRKPDVKESLTTEPLPEPVPIAEIISNIETEKTYWAVDESCGKTIVEVSLIEGISDVRAETFEDSRGHDIPWDSIYRTLPDAERIAESRGWE
jgi:hypothetical protein